MRQRLVFNESERTMSNTFMVGDLEVLVVADGDCTFPAPLYFPASTKETWAEHARWMDHEGNLTFPFSCFLVRSGDRRVLIDTGLGWLKMFTFTGGALLGELAKADVKPEDIDTVFVTHLHVDHCGTCVVPDGESVRAAFPKATYRWTSAEHEHWLHAPQAPGSDFTVRDMQEVLADRFEPAQDGATIAPGVSVYATPGHTPGHASVILSSGSERAFVLGDAISCPVQLEEPEWSGLGDMDKELARKSQEAALREIEGSNALLTAAHFPGLTFGRVLRGEGKRYWEPVK
jgi:glyoxylase-like metal-dependent hydrolase (beta-lactamase superfamily II)